MRSGRKADDELPPFDVEAALAKLADEAMRIVQGQPQSVLGIVIAERGTDLHAWLRESAATERLQEIATRWICAVLNADAVIEFVRNAGGDARAEGLRRQTKIPGQWLPFFVMTKDQGCNAGTMERPPGF